MIFLLPKRKKEKKGKEESKMAIKEFPELDPDMVRMKALGMLPRVISETATEVKWSYGADEEAETVSVRPIEEACAACLDRPNNVEDCRAFAKRNQALVGLKLTICPKQFSDYEEIMSKED